MLEILGVTKDPPVPRLVPPVETLYQLRVPADAVALKVKVPVPHLLAGVVVAIVGIAFTVANTGVLAPAAQPFTLKASA